MEQELITLGILFLFALIGGVLATRFKQPILLGLIMVGAIIGPKALGLIKSESALEPMIEFGAILMLFVLGLEFDIPRLQKIGIKAIIIATLNSLLLTFVGFTVSMLIGFNVQASLFIGVILSFGSTVVIVKVLENKGMMNRQEVPLLIAVLIIEDILAVIIITFFSGMTNKSVGLLGNIETLIISMILLIVSYIVFIKFIKPVLAWVLKNNKSEEISTFTALALCAGFAYLAYALKLSPAVGAFMAGSIVASLPNSKEFEKLVAPYNLIISSFFFIAIGTLVDFAAIKEHIWIIIILVAIVMVTKMIAFSSLVYFFANMKGERMFFSSIAMFSVGEFSLLVAKESAKFNVGIDLVSISAAIVAISAVLMSISISYSDKIYEPTIDRTPYRMRRGIERVSAYIKSVSDELDLDNKYSQALKKNTIGIFTTALAVLLIIFGWRKIGTIMTSAGMSYTLINAGMILTMMILAVGMLYIAFKARKVFKLLSEIFANATNSRNHAQCKKIVSKTFTITALLFMTLLSPFIMFMFDLGLIYLIIPAIFIIMISWNIYSLSKIAGEEHTEYYAASKKFEFNVKNGWKM